MLVEETNDYRLPYFSSLWTISNFLSYNDAIISNFNNDLKMVPKECGFVMVDGVGGGAYKLS